MKRLFILLILNIGIQLSVSAQCNEGLNLGAVVVPTHGNSSNGGNFMNPVAWHEAANLVDSLNLDYRQKYISWTDVVSQIISGVPVFSGYYNFENQLTTWAGNCNVHIVYPTIKVGLSNTTMPEPTGFISKVDSTNAEYFSDSAYVNQNYLAIKHILQNVNNIKWISVGNEIDTYFKNAYWGTGRLTRYTAFLDTIRNRMIKDGFSNIKLGSVVTFHNLTWSGNYDIIDSIRSHVDFVGYTFYYTSLGPPNDTCWGNPATVASWLNIAKTKAGNKKIMLTETCMGDGAGVFQNCGSPSKQLEYADTLLNWYKNDTNNIIGITWFTIVDPYLGWQTSNTLWNNCGLIDSNGVTVQSAGELWRHDCSTNNIYENLHENNFAVFPNPASEYIEISVGAHYNVFQRDEKIYNIFGECVANVETGLRPVSVQRIDVSELHAGIYFISINTTNKIFIKLP